MKKTIKLLFICALCFVLGITLIACGDKNKGSDTNGENISFKTPEEIAAAFSNGKFTVKISSTGSSPFYYTVIQADNGYFYSYYDAPKAVLDGDLVIKEGNTYKYYTVADGKRAFVIASESDSTATQYVDNLFSTYFSAYAGIGTDGFNKKGSSTVAGRACTKYLFSYKGFGTEVSYEYYIDNDTGMCLKYVGAMSAGGESGSYSWEMTEFVLGNASLSAYTSLPIEGSGEGPNVGNTTTWPANKIAALASFFTETTLPALDGATKFTYVAESNSITISAEGIDQTEYDAYIQKLTTDGYVTTESVGSVTAKKLLSAGNMISVSLSFNPQTSIVVFMVDAIPACEAEAVLPQNLKIVFEDADGTEYTYIKIGNDFYKEYTDGGYTYKNFAKYNATAKNWDSYLNNADTAYTWESRDYTYDDLDSVLCDLFDSVYTENYLSKDSYTLNGTIKVAGADCNVFIGDDYGTTVTYYKSFNNLVLKKVTGEGSADDFCVTVYDTTVTAFSVQVP